MKIKALFFTSIFAAAAMCAVPAWADDVEVKSGRTRLDANSTGSGNTYTVTGGQLWLWSVKTTNKYTTTVTPTTFNINAELNGEGCANGSVSAEEAKAALRLHEGSTLSGTVTIGADTRIWSSGRNNNAITGAISTADTATSASLTIVGQSGNFTGKIQELKLSGGMDLSKGVLKFEGAATLYSSSVAASLTLTGTDKSYTAQSIASTSVDTSKTAHILKIDSGVEFIISNSATSAGADQTFSGNLAGEGTLEITSGVQKLAGTTASTAIVVSGGVLEAANTKALGSGTTSVEDGGVLKISVAGATAGTVKLASGAKFAIDLNALSGGEVEVDKALTVITASAISFNSYNDLGTVTVTSEEIEKYFSADKSDLGDFSSYARKWNYDSTNGTLTLTFTAAVPEPSMFGLLAGAGALAFVAARRRRRAK